MLDATGTAALRVRRALRHRRRRAPARRRPPRARRAARVFMSPALPDHPAAARARRPSLRRAELPEYEGWAKANRHYWAQRLPRLPRVLLRPLLPRAALDEADRGRVGWALEATPETLAHTIAAPDLDEPSVARAARPHPLPAARHPGRRGPADPAATAAPRSPRRPAPSSSSGRASATARSARHPVPFNLMLRDFAERAFAAAATPPAVAPRAAPPQARALRLLADRPRPRLARRRDRARAARARARSSRSTGSPRIRSRACSRRCGERIHPASASARQRVAPHRGRGARARAQRLPGLAADGRDPARELHALPRRRDRRALRPLDRRRGVGARLLPAREPGAEDAPPTASSPTSSAGCRCPRAAPTRRA